MNDRILIALDGSDRSETALRYALETFPDAVVTALFVRDPFGHYTAEQPFPSRVDDWMAQLDERADEIFDRASAIADEYDRTIETERRSGKPAREIVAAAVEGGFDGIVLGNHGSHGVTDVLLGNVAKTVVDRAPVTVTIVRADKS
ncbi:MAG: universal stress protein [Halobacteriota archaeon]